MVESTADLEVLLQHASPDDPLVWQAVVRMYAPAVQTLAWAAEETGEGAEAAVERVFSDVLPALAQYPVGTPLNIWFFRRALRVLRSPRLPDRLRSLQPAKAKQSSAAAGHPSVEAGAGGLDPLRALNRGDRLLLTLHLGLGVPAEGLAEIHGLRYRVILSRLERAGRRMQTLQPGAVREPMPSPGPSAAHRRARRNTFRSGSLTIEDEAALNEHLEECAACRGYARSMAEFAEELQGAHGSDQPAAEAAATALLDRIRGKANRSRGIARANRMGREVGWVLSAALAFLLIGWAYNQLSAPVDEVENALENSVTPTPPALIQGTARRVVSIQPTPRATEPGFGQPESSWDPAISADGEWVVFASTYSNLVPDDTNLANDIFIVERRVGAIERISVNSEGSEANNGSFEPSVSRDGRLVAFTSWADNLAAGDRLGCELWGTRSSCPDVYVRDRQTGETLLISRNPDGEPGDNFSFAPQISSDGRWVVFWSAASDLVAGDTEVCGLRPSRFNCLDLFAYDLTTESMIRLPVGREFDFYPHYYNLSLTEGGRWILFQLDQRDRVAAQMEMENPSDLFLYDRDTAEILPVNVNGSGEHGNQPAYAGAISADGRWVVFSSDASNLVPGDTNEKIDIFLRNRVTGAVRRISLGPEGEEMYRDSGVTQGREGWLADGLAISGQGRWVLFLSDAASIPRDIRQPACNIRPPWGCQNLMLYDRETDQSKPINLTNVDLIPFANLSADGGVAAFMAHSLNCDPEEFCQDIYLYERENESVNVVGRQALSLQPGQLMVLKQENALVLGLHEQHVTALDFSSDGQLLASGSRDRTVALYSPPENRLLQRLEGHTSAITSLEFSPDGQLLAVGLQESQVYLWRMPEGALQGVLELDRTVHDLAFSPDGGVLAVASQQGLSFWDVAEGLRIGRLGQLAGQKITQVAYHPRGELLAAAAGETTWLFEMPSGKALMRLAGHEDEINDLAFTSNGRYLVSASDDRSANIWRIVRSNGGRFGASLNLTIQHGDWVTSLATGSGPESPLLATGSFDNTIGVWDPRRGTLFSVPYRTTQNQVLSLAMSASGHHLAAGTVRGEVHLWLDLWSILNSGG